MEFSGPIAAAIKYIYIYIPVSSGNTYNMSVIFPTSRIRKLDQSYLVTCLEFYNSSIAESEFKSRLVNHDILFPSITPHCCQENTKLGDE